VLQGKELSYTEPADLDAAARIVLEFDEPAAAVDQAHNPCGAATGSTAATHYVRAREADPLSAFGGIVALNRPLDADVAAALVSTRLDAVIAPSVDDAAREILAKKGQMRVVTADFSRLRESAGRELRSILGAVLCRTAIGWWKRRRRGRHPRCRW
jgi:phosphoribosylaminoimidazolecarboxamide formyltransferase/IMP cyclohydrolase